MQRCNGATCMPRAVQISIRRPSANGFTKTTGERKNPREREHERYGLGKHPFKVQLWVIDN
jgi:hypothetical protein